MLFRVGPVGGGSLSDRRDGDTFAPGDNRSAGKSSSIENYLRFTALLYLFIGLFIFVRRWNAPRAIHFYIFCLVSFVLYSFHYSGKLNSFDRIDLLGKRRGAAVAARFAGAFRAGVS